VDRGTPGDLGEVQFDYGISKRTSPEALRKKIRRKSGGRITFLTSELHEPRGGKLAGKENKLRVERGGQEKNKACRTVLWTLDLYGRASEGDLLKGRLSTHGAFRGDCGIVDIKHSEEVATNRMDTTIGGQARKTANVSLGSKEREEKETPNEGGFIGGRFWPLKNGKTRSVWQIRTEMLRRKKVLKNGVTPMDKEKLTSNLTDV